jgi:hypothetical protein
MNICNLQVRQSKILQFIPLKPKIYCGAELKTKQNRPSSKKYLQMYMLKYHCFCFSNSLYMQNITKKQVLDLADLLILLKVCTPFCKMTCFYRASCLNEMRPWHLQSTAWDFWPCFRINLWSYKMSQNQILCWKCTLKTTSHLNPE